MAGRSASGRHLLGAAAAVAPSFGDDSHGSSHGGGSDGGGRQQRAMRIDKRGTAGHVHGSAGGHYEASCVFLIEGCFLSPAFGALLPWKRIHTPTRRLDAVLHFPSPSEWEDFHLMPGRAPRADSEGVHRVEGPINDLAIRVRAVHHGGCSLASRIIVVRPPHTLRLLTLETPPSLPAKARALLSIEDLLRSTAKIHGGLSSDVQYFHVQTQLLTHLPRLTQMFRLFALTFSAKPSTIYSLSRAQFRGMLIGLGISPAKLPNSHIPILFAKAKRAMRTEEAAEALEEDGEGAETRGLRDLNGLGVTHFIAALLRVAHAIYPELNEQGVGAQLDKMMHEYVLPGNTHLE